MSLDAPTRPSPVLSDRRQLVEWIRVGEKPRARHRLGIETEKLGVLSDTGEAPPLDGPRSTGDLLRRLAAEHGTLLVENGVPIGVDRHGYTLALEPGGQLELSGTPTFSVSEAAHEIEEHLTRVKALGDPLGLSFLATGYRPFGDRANVPWLPRGRYALMKAKLGGFLAHDMMQLTASVQANFDFENEADLAAKVSTANAISPLVAALAANSPLKDGAPSGEKSFRYRLWRDVDPHRCGLLRFMYEPGFTYDAYVDWAVHVPLLFVRRDGKYLDADGRNFADLLRDGFDGRPATEADFPDLLSTLFPALRVKRVVEVRGADAVDTPLTFAIAALWLGILYDPESLRAARDLVHVDFDTLVKFQADVARDALDATLAGTRAQVLAAKLVAIAEDGLRRRFERGEGADDRRFLAPLHEIARTGRTRADDLLAWIRDHGTARDGLLGRLAY